MRILMCNNFYYLRGGAERYTFELTTLLEKHGHEVIPFCMTHENNFSTPYSRYFVSYIDFPSLLKSKPSLIVIMKVIERLFYSHEAKQKIKQLIDETRPDIVHIQGIGHEISPLILDVIKSFNIPIVQTLHDYGLLCPNTSFISQGTVCEMCKGHRYYNVVLKRCKRNSLGASLLACLGHYLHALLNIYEKNVDLYVSPSKFLRQKMIEHGIRKEIVTISNFVNLNQFNLSEVGSGYCVFAGRLVSIKGVSTLIEAAKLNRQVRVFIAGDGELKDELQKEILKHHLDHVTLLGHVDAGELIQLVSGSNFTVLPSECYENYPMSIVESFACGKPVIASNIGAIPDQVIDGWNGLLFEPGNAIQLADRIQYLFDHPEKAADMGMNGRQSVLTKNDPELHYQQVVGIYQRLLDSSRQQVEKTE
jgi:glycosyltransferase involved in cell wall biosynthesis